MAVRLSRQTQAGVGYGRKLGENIAVGVQLDLIHTGVTDLETAIHLLLRLLVVVQTFA